MSSNTNSELNKIFFFLFFLFCLFNAGFLCDLQNKRVDKRYYEKTFQGKIINIYSDKYNKGFITYTIKNNLDTFKRWLFVGNEDATIYFKKEDSIVKPSNSFDIYLYKHCNKDSLIYFKSDFADYKEYIEELKNQQNSP